MNNIDKITKDWERYEAGKTFNNAIKCPNDINYYEMIDAVLAFFGGDQWRNVKAEDMPKPVFNYIKRTLQFFVASLKSTNTSLTFENIEHQEDTEDKLVDIMNSEVKYILEKMKFENRIQDLLFDAGQTGDACMHFWFDANKKEYKNIGKICHEIVDGSNVMFGNANNSNVEDQPYIIIVGRDLAENLQEEAKRYKTSTNKEEIEKDTDYIFMPGDNAKIEIDVDKYGKSLYILIYERDKKTGKIKVSKSVKNTYIYQDIDTGLEYYPITWLNWEKQKNNYHGKGIVIDMIPNQIVINKMFAMIVYHLMLTAFPTAIYNGDKLNAWTNELGAAIELKDMQPGETINGVAGYIQPGQMSNQIITAFEQAIRYSKECIGVSDASLGAIDPKNATAIIAIQKSAVVPLENVRNNLYEFIEDIGRILLDMISTYYNTRTVIIKDENGTKTEEFDFNQLKGKWLNVKADVGASAYYSEIANIQTLDNLLAGEKIDFLEYLERMPENIIPNKAGLIESTKKKLGITENATQQEQPENIAQVNPEQAQQMAAYEDTLPVEVQKELERLPDAKRVQTVMQMMSQDNEYNKETLPQNTQPTM